MFLLRRGDRVRHCTHPRFKQPQPGAPLRLACVSCLIASACSDGSGNAQNFAGDATADAMVNAADAAARDQGTDGPPDAVAYPDAELAKEAGTPVFNPPSGSPGVCSIDHCEGTSACPIVTISSTSANAVIRYTWNGTDPEESSDIYSKPLWLSPGVYELRARAYAAGYVPSAVAIAQYRVYPPPGEGAPPNDFSTYPSMATYDNDLLVFVTHSFEPCGGICITLDGSSPDCDPAALRCVGGAATYDPLNGIVVDGRVTSPDGDGGVIIRISACTRRPVEYRSMYYTLAVGEPQLAVGTLGLSSTPLRRVEWGTDIGLSTITSGSRPPWPTPARIHYAVDGSVATCSTTWHIDSDPASDYQTAARIGGFVRNTVIHAIGCKTGYAASKEVTYSVEIALPRVRLDPPPGTYRNEVAIAIDRAPNGELGLPQDEIACVSHDGSVPECSGDGGSCVSGSLVRLAGASGVNPWALTLTSSAVISAVACSGGNAPSAITNGTYIVQ